MAGLRDFVSQLLDHGEVALSELPTPDESELLSTFRRLELAFLEHSLSVAGPLLPFESALSLDLAMWLGRASWFYLVPEIELTANHELKWPELYAATPANHLNVDVLLRFAITVYRRAKVRQADDILTADLEAMFRRWPLTGVLADIVLPPTVDLEFGGHRGLQLLYAERLANHYRDAWLPPFGRTREVFDAVCAEMR